MRRPLISAVALTVLASTPASAGAAQQYFVGKGDAYKTKVSFRVVDGEVKHGLVESQVPNKGPAGPSRLPAFGAFRATDLDAKQHFSCRVDREGIDPFHPNYHFKFAGKVAGGEAVGRTSARASDRLTDFKTGPVQWTAERVSKSRYESFVGIGDALAEDAGRPGCK